MKPGAQSDISAFRDFDLDLPEGATLYADKAYTDYEHEDFLKENNCHLIAERKANSKRSMDGCLRYVQNYWRKRIETTFSQITGPFPKYIHAVTSKGFELKIFAFILVYSLTLMLQ